MKKFVKVVSVNDGNPVEVYNGDRIYTETYPRLEKIIEAFLSGGWTLANMLKNINPSIQREGAYTFYCGGWDLVFMKETEDGENDGDEILRRALAQVLESDDDGDGWQSEDDESEDDESEDDEFEDDEYEDDESADDETEDDESADDETEDDESADDETEDNGAEDDESEDGEYEVDEEHRDSMWEEDE